MTVPSHQASVFPDKERILLGLICQRVFLVFVYRDQTLDVRQRNQESYVQCNLDPINQKCYHSVGIIQIHLFFNYLCQYLFSVLYASNIIDPNMYLSSTLDMSKAFDFVGMENWYFTKGNIRFSVFQRI